MLRNLNETLPDGRAVLGNPFLGPTGQEILDQTSSGVSGPGCLYSAGLSLASRYRILLETHNLGVDFLLLPNGSGEAYTDGSAVYRLFEDNAEVAAVQANRTITIGTPTPPQFLVQPQNSVVLSGGTMTLTAAVIGSPTPSLQWRRNGTAIPGAVGSTFTLANVQVTDSGAQFSVAAVNASGTVISSTATLTVGVVPTISTQPQGTSRFSGQTVTLSCVAAGSSPLSYQWYRNSQAISGANSASYTSPALLLSDSGVQYSVSVVNVYGTITSVPATVTVSEAPVAASITVQPTNYVATEAGTALFEVTAIGSIPLVYQWYRNGSAIPGETYRTLLLSSVSIAMDGHTFYCTASNTYGSAISATALLSVTPLVVAPTILAQPISATVNEGAIVTFTVGATGSSPMTYQWMRNGVDIPGATLASYTMDAALVSDTGAQFSAFLSNAAGSVTSQVAVLTVIDLPEPTEYPLDLAQWPAGRVVRKSRNGFSAWPLNYGDSDYFGFDFGGEFTAKMDDGSFIASVTVTPFFPVVGATSSSYRDGDPVMHGTFVVQRIKANVALGRHVVRCTVTSTSGKKVTRECTLYVLKTGQGFIR